MSDETSPLIAIAGNVKTDPGAPAAAEALGRELAKGGFRILVYSSGADFLEGILVRGYIASRVANRRSVQVRYPLAGLKPAFPEQVTNPDLFDFRPDNNPDWEISFYQSLNDVDGLLLMGGGSSTMVAGLVAIGHGKAMLALPGFGGMATKVWQTLVPGRDLPTGDERSQMARPGWSDDQAAECVGILKSQLERKADIDKQRKLEERRRETSVTLHASFAVVLFLLAVACIYVAWGWPHSMSQPIAMLLLFISPLLAGVAGSTIRLVFDLREGSMPLSSQSAITTASLGMIAGGLAGLLFIIAQVTTAPQASGQIVGIDQATKLVPFAVIIGFVAGLTLDAVFRKLIASDVVDLSAIPTKKHL